MHSRLPILAGPLLVIAAIAIFWANPFGPSLTHTNEHRIRLVTIAENLDHPWGLAFLPNGDMLVTERAGRLRLIHNGALQDAWVYGAPRPVVKAQAGVMDVALHPRFVENGLIYLNH